jgi:hypothetical protein
MDDFVSKDCIKSKCNNTIINTNCPSGPQVNYYTIYICYYIDDKPSQEEFDTLFGRFGVKPEIIERLSLGEDDRDYDMGAYAIKEENLVDFVKAVADSKKFTINMICRAPKHEVDANCKFQQSEVKPFEAPSDSESESSQEESSSHDELSSNSEEEMIVIYPPTSEQEESELTDLEKKIMTYL